MVVPWLVVGIPIAGGALRVMRARTLEVQGEDYLRTARAKGLSEREVFRHHALRPAVTPVLMMAGATANVILLNMFLVERAFSIPGVFQNLNRTMDTGDLRLQPPRGPGADGGRPARAPASHGVVSSPRAPASAADTRSSGGSSARSASRPKQTVPS
jgi:hypothetical protein